MGCKRYPIKRYLIGYKYHNFFLKNVLFNANCRPSNIRSFHTYGVRYMCFFVTHCKAWAHVFQCNNVINLLNLVWSQLRIRSKVGGGCTMKVIGFWPLKDGKRSFDVVFTVKGTVIEITKPPLKESNIISSYKPVQIWPRHL